MPVYIPLSQKELDSESNASISDTVPPGRSRLGRSLEKILKAVCYTTVFATCIFAAMTTRSVGQSMESLSPWKIQTRFGSERDFMSLDRQFDHLWADIDSPAASIVRLPPENEGGSRRLGSIAMFHQLHCLSSLRKALQASHEGEDIGVDWHDNDHWPHCMYYLRQAILCAADDTIELPGPYSGKKNRTIDGAFDLRTCRDARPLFELQARDGLVII